MKIDHEKYADIGKIDNFLGENVSMQLPHVHAISGWDTTSFFFGVEKVKLSKEDSQTSRFSGAVRIIGKG